MKLLFIISLLTASFLYKVVPHIQLQFSNDLKAGLCVKEQIALGVERINIIKKDGGCYVK